MKEATLSLSLHLFQRAYVQFVLVLKGNVPSAHCKKELKSTTLIQLSHNSVHQFRACRFTVNCQQFRYVDADKGKLGRGRDEIHVPAERGDGLAGIATIRAVVQKYSIGIRRLKEQPTSAQTREWRRWPKQRTTRATHVHGNTQASHLHQIVESLSCVLKTVRHGERVRDTLNGSSA